MDLIAMACQEVGLDLTGHAVVETVSSQDVWRQSSQLAWQEDTSQEGWQDDTSQESWQDNSSQESWQLHLVEEDSRARPVIGSRVVTPKLLSFGGDLTNTVFTDKKGKESTVKLQFSPSLRPSNGINPVTNLYSQRKNNPKFPRRSRQSQVSAGIQGAPCRNLPDLPSGSDQSKPKSRSEQYPVLEVPSLPAQPHPVLDINPFLHLFQDTRPGQVAFAYYVSDCWSSFGGSSGVPDQSQFLRQCEGWWINLPTPYRRGYWTREVEHYKDMTRQRTWQGHGQVGSDSKVKVMVVSKEGEKKNKQSKNIRLVDVKEDGQPSPPKKMMTAFKHFQAKFKSKVSEEMVGASGMEVRRELGKRWKALSNEKKLEFVKIKENDEEKENCGVFVKDVVNGEDQLDIKCKTELEQTIGDFVAEEDANGHQQMDLKCETEFEQISEDLSLDYASNDEVKPSFLMDCPAQSNESEMIVNITLDEIDKFAIETKFYTEDKRWSNYENPELELSLPEKKVLELVTDISKIEVDNTSD